MTDLAAIQRAFHAAITGGAPLASALSLVEAGGAPALARLHVYANAYFARIADVLVADYPKLHALLGAPAFRSLIVPYLRAYPTRHPSLREAGAHLPDFLDDPLLVDLARLERARVEAFDGPDCTPLSRDALAATPPEAFPALPLHLVPTARLVDLATNADAIWDALEAEAAVPARRDREPGSRATWACTVAVWRRETTVVHRTLAADEVAPLAQLARGATFAEICACFADVPDGVERALALLLGWLDAGLLA